MHQDDVKRKYVMQFADSDVFRYGMAIKHSRTSCGHYALPDANNVAYLAGSVWSLHKLCDAMPCDATVMQCIAVLSLHVARWLNTFC